MALYYLWSAISTSVILLLISISPTLLPVYSQVVGCSLVSIDLQNCLVPSTQRTPLSIGSCCTTLNLVIEAGYYCLCTLLGPSSGYSMFTAELQLSSSDCNIAVPPLTHCHEPPTAATPLLMNPPLAPPLVSSLLPNEPPPLPPVNPVFPALQPPDLARDDEGGFVPLPPNVSEMPLSVNSNSTVVDGSPVLNSSPLPLIGIPERWDHVNSDAKMWVNSRNVIVLVTSLWMYCLRI